MGNLALEIAISLQLAANRESHSLNEDDALIKSQSWPKYSQPGFAKKSQGPDGYGFSSFADRVAISTKNIAVCELTVRSFVLFW